MCLAAHIRQSPAVTSLDLLQYYQDNDNDILHFCIIIIDINSSIK